MDISVKRYTLELYNDYSYLALYKFFDFHSCLNVMGPERVGKDDKRKYL